MRRSHFGMGYCGTIIGGMRLPDVSSKSCQLSAQKDKKS